MSQVVAFESVTLDGVMQAPGRPDEDTREGFQDGGWARPYADQDLGRIAAEGMATTEAILLGRRTYQDFYGFWPHQPDNPFTEALNNTRKYVASNSLEEPLEWQNSVLLKGDVAQAVARLRDEPGQDIVVLGSGELVQTLIKHGLVDRIVLLIHPLVLGTGRRLFPDGLSRIPLRLEGSTTTSMGVIVATYAPEKEETG
jgi:dihydrofolate reductase